MYLYIRQVLFRTGKVLTVDISSIIQQADRFPPQLIRCNKIFPKVIPDIDKLRISILMVFQSQTLRI
mgnify:CR=1 FL=1